MPDENHGECRTEGETETHRALIRRVAGERDAEAFDALTDALREPLRRFLLSRLHGDAAATEDVLQETLLRLWTRADGYDGRGPVKAWLFRIAANLASNHRRTLARRREEHFDPADDPADDDEHPTALLGLLESGELGPDALAVRADERARVRCLLADLPEEAREMLRLVHEEERDLRDVAAAMGVPEGTVKSRLFYTRKRLARAWGAAQDDQSKSAPDA
jgi:RNA polymerase sigma-70 factor, ECF subfamily